MEAVRAVEDAVAVELEVHLSRLESDGAIRQGLRQPVSALLRQVLGRVRQTQGSVQSAEVVSNMQRVAQDKARLEGRLREMEAEVSKSRELLKSGGGPNGNTAAVLARCEHLVKEREAVQTIMEQKIKVLVQSIAQASGGVLQAGEGRNVNPLAASALAKDVAALQRLVNASIAALRNAASSAPAA